MEIYLIANNLLVDNIKYNDENIDIIKSLKVLSSDGEKEAKKISNLDELSNVENIYSSMFASSIGSAKYLSEKYDTPINLDNKLNDCKVGILQNKSIKFIKNLQDHDFNYKLYNGESLNEVGLRMNSIITNIINKNENSIIFTHKRSILGYFLRFASVGYNLDDELILEYNNEVIYSNNDDNVIIYKLSFNTNKIEKIEKIII